MDRTEVMEKLKKIMLSFDEDIDLTAVSENSQFVRDLGFNSMQMLCMAVMTEESFGCRIDADCYKNIKTVGDIITLICGMQCRTNRTLP